MPDIIIVAGPNGAGKSTFIERYLPAQGQTSVVLNADEIERELESDTGPPETRALRAGRLMLGQLDDAIAFRRNVIIETTLALRTYAVKIPAWRLAGYRIALIYLRLATVENSIARVQHRVRNKGHDIPEQTIRRRFPQSLSNLEHIYKPIVDEWYVWESIEGGFVPAEAWDLP